MTDTADKSPRMIYQTPESRRGILDTALELFLQKGFFDTQMKDVAHAAGISRSTLYRYFQDKTDLASCLLEEVFASFMADSSWRDSVPAGASARTALGCYLKNHWLSPRFEKQMVFLAEFDAYFSGGRIPAGTAVAAQFRENLAARLHFPQDPFLADFLSRGAIDGSLRADLDQHLVGVTLLNAVRSLHQRVLLRGDILIEALPGEPGKMPQTLVDLLLDGLAPSQGDLS